mmetsp:Transcript_5864/g.10544  ORF Transcript_5864/g.10544 Transcript_5864/m.10544 type:complete len:193 (-) Transcript_5864:370-948(-)
MVAPKPAPKPVAKPAAKPAHDDDDDFDPTKNSRFWLIEHIAFKGIQAGALLGAITGLTYLGFKKELHADTLGKYAAVGSATGAVGVSLLSVAKVVKLNDEEVADRVYRLHYNKNINRMDNLSMTGMLVGGLASVAYDLSKVDDVKSIKLDASTAKGLALTFVGGAALGAAVGTVTHLLTFKIDTKNMTKELE